MGFGGDDSSVYCQDSPKNHVQLRTKQTLSLAPIPNPVSVTIQSTDHAGETNTRFESIRTLTLNLRTWAKPHEFQPGRKLRAACPARQVP